MTTKLWELTYRNTSRLWVVDSEYPLLGSLATMLKYDREWKRLRAKSNLASGVILHKPSWDSAAFPKAAYEADVGAATIWTLITHHMYGEEMAAWSRREGVIVLGFGETGDLRHQRFQNPLTRTDFGRYPAGQAQARAFGGH